MYDLVGCLLEENALEVVRWRIPKFRNSVIYKVMTIRDVIKYMSKVINIYMYRYCKRKKKQIGNFSVVFAKI